MAKKFRDKKFNGQKIQWPKKFRDKKIQWRRHNVFVFFIFFQVTATTAAAAAATTTTAATRLLARMFFKKIIKTFSPCSFQILAFLLLGPSSSPLTVAEGVLVTFFFSSSASSSSSSLSMGASSRPVSILNVSLVLTMRA